MVQPDNRTRRYRKRSEFHALLDIEIHLSFKGVRLEFKVTGLKNTCLGSINSGFRHTVFRMEILEGLLGSKVREGGIMLHSINRFLPKPINLPNIE